MRFLLDEGADFRLAAFLAGRGHDITTIVRDHPRALKDEEVLAIARRQGRILITNDTDFGELIHRRRLVHRGVILLRIRSHALEVTCARLARLLAQFPDDLDKFVVVTDAGIRIRRTQA